MAGTLRRLLGGTALLLSTITSAPVGAYDLDFGVDDFFLVERTPNKGGASETEVWHVSIHRGLIDGAESFVDCRFVVIALSPPTRGERNLRDLAVYEGEPGQCRFSGTIMTAEFGALDKLLLKVEFNGDGSLKDLTGSRTFLGPTSASGDAVYRLVHGAKKLSMVLANRIADKGYRYQARAGGADGTPSGR
jgi:hypothetical protein